MGSTRHHLAAGICKPILSSLPSIHLSVRPSLHLVYLCPKSHRSLEICQLSLPNQIPWSAKFSIHLPKIHTKQCSVGCLSAFCSQLFNGLFRTHFIYYFGDFLSKELNTIEPYSTILFRHILPLPCFHVFSHIFSHAHLQHLQKVPHTCPGHLGSSCSWYPARDSVQRLRSSWLQYPHRCLGKYLKGLGELYKWDVGWGWILQKILANTCCIRLSCFKILKFFLVTPKWYCINKSHIFVFQLLKILNALW